MGLGKSFEGVQEVLFGVVQVIHAELGVVLGSRCGLVCRERAHCKSEDKKYGKSLAHTASYGIERKF
jgi:hypothetical protein